MANSAPITFTNALVKLATSTGVANVDVSDHIKAVRLTFEADELDDTTMGLTSRSRVQGLFNWSAEMDILQDFSTTGSRTFDNMLFDLENTKTKFTVALRPVNANESSDNPQYEGQVRLFGYQPMSGTVGDLLMVTVPFRSASNLSRLTSAT